MKIFDPTFGIKPQALAIANLLNTFDLSELMPEDAWEDRQFRDNIVIKSYPFYNGREVGIIMEFKTWLSEKSFFVNFCEHRNSDSLFVQFTTKPSTFNNPDLDIFDDNDYANRKFFKYGEYIKVVDKIKSLVLAYYTQLWEDLQMVRNK